jgi:FAD/FMN-containing dehydrogenase
MRGPDEVIISLQRMNRIERVEPRGGTTTVEAGIVLDVLQETVAEQGLLFPLDPNDLLNPGRVLSCRV